MRTARAAVAGFLRENESRAIDYVRRVTGADVLSHKPEDLLRIDAVLTLRHREILRQRNQVDGAATAFGTFLGEVFVRNLAGQWHYPTWLQAVRGSLSRNPSAAAERYFYITLGEERVYVLQTAREAIEKTGPVLSLYAFYQRYAEMSREPSPLANPAFQRR